MRNVIVLGSGRSGTSMLAGTLASAGYDLGGTPYPPRDANPKGFFETHAVNGVNEEILAATLPRHPRFEAGQRWLAELALDTPLVVPDSARQRIVELVQRSPYCFKDPRFCHTLEAWRPHAQGALVLCVFRDPAVTARSILQECREAPYLKSLPMFFERALATWTNMYAHALQSYRREAASARAADWRFVHYDQLLESSGLERLAEWTGASIDTSFPEASLDRTRCSRAVDAATAEIYAQLCALAKHEPKRRAQVVIPAAPPPAVGDVESASPRLSVILCTYNRRAILERSLASFFRQDAPAGGFELIVVDDGSQDGTREYLQGLALPIPGRILHRENGGLAAARNTGIAAARGEYFLFVNDDTIASTSLVREHLAAHDKAGRDIAVLGTFEQPLPALDNALMRVLEVTDLVFHYNEMRPGAFYDYQRFWTCNVSVRAELVRDAGGFDERFKRYGAEDIDLGFRLGELGVEVLYHASARAQHDHILDFETFKRRQRTCGAAFVDLFAKEPRCLLHRDWDWMRSRTLADLERFVDEHRSRVPALEAAAKALSVIDLGALDASEAQLGSTVGTILKELGRLMRELNAVWWQQGLIDGLRSIGCESFDELLGRLPTPTSVREIQFSSTAAETARVAKERLEDVRALAESGELALATIEAIRVLCSLPDEARRERAEVLNDLAVLRYSVEDGEGSVACVEAALKLAPENELARANQRDLRAASAKMPPRWGKRPDSKALPTDLNPWVAEALELARTRLGFHGRDVLEVGGAVPHEAATATGARRWCAGYLGAEALTDGSYERRALDARALPFEDASFDAIFSSCAFEHINDFERALAEMRRVLRPGGAIVTHFAPIWSCAVGHHLWENDAQGERVTFLDRIVPDWGHLLLDARELSTYLEIVLGADTARRAVDFITRNDCINRLFEGDFQRLFRAAGFDAGGLERVPAWDARHVATSAMRAELLTRYPRGGDFDTPGLRGVLPVLSTRPARTPARALATARAAGVGA